MDSEVGKGSTFHFTADFEYDEQDQPHTHSDVVPHHLSALVVHPHPLSREVYREMLASQGIRVTVAASSDEAIQHLQQATSPASSVHIVVVGGAAHSDRSAHALAAQISQATNTRGIPLLLLACAGDDTGIAAHGRWQKSCVVNTPISTGELCQALSETLGTVHLVVEHPTAVNRGREVRPLRILLAEDCLVNREVAVGLLELRGHQVHLVSSGQEAVDALQTDVFDVVLMDVEMPGMDGIQATQLIREAERSHRRRTPIIAMTAHALQGFQHACLEAGMDEYISKPIDPQTLYRVVETTVSHSQSPSA